MGLQLLEEVVHRQLGVAVVEPHDHPERHQVLPERVDERAAELAVSGLRTEGPAHRVDHAVERSRDLPDFLHPERPDLRVLTVQAGAVERDAGQMSLGPLRQNGDARDDVGPWLEVRELLALAPASLVSGAHASHARALDEQLHRRGLGEDHRAAFLGPLGQPASEL